MNNSSVLHVLYSFIVVAVVVILYIISPKPKPLILKFLLILFVAAAIIGILAGLIVPLITYKNKMTNGPKQIFEQIEKVNNISPLTKEKVEDFFNIRLIRSDEPPFHGEENFDIYNNTAGCPFSLIQLFQPTAKSDFKEGYLNLNICQELNVSEEEIKDYFGEPKVDFDQTEAGRGYFRSLTYVSQSGEITFNFNREKNQLIYLVIDHKHSN